MNKRLVKHVRDRAGEGDKLPERLRAVAERRMRQAYHAESALKAEGLLTELAAELDKTHPGAAASFCRGHSKNVKRWRNGPMALRWCAAGMLEADHQFRRVNGHLHLPRLRAALEAHFKNASAVSQDDGKKVA